MKKFFIMMLVVLVFTVFTVPEAYAGIAGKEKVKKAQKDSANPIVYVKEKGKKYHKRICKQIKGKKGLKLSEALEKGYTPCSLCKPGGAAVYLNPKGKKVHVKGCKMIKKNAVKLTPAEVKKKKLASCKICSLQRYKK